MKKKRMQHNQDVLKRLIEFRNVLERSIIDLGELVRELELQQNEMLHQKIFGLKKILAGVWSVVEETRQEFDSDEGARRL